MRAAQYHAARDIRVVSVPSPTPKPNQVLVDIEWCGICGSDLHEYLVGPVVVPRDKPHQLTGECLPVTMGHEFCGRISQVPAGVDEKTSRLKVGQPVMVDPRLLCKSCGRCAQDKSNICKVWGFLGLSGTGGGLSETIAVDPEMCYVLPDSVDLRFAALIEPLTVGRHALKSSGFLDFTSSNVLILGGGPVGLAVAMNLKAQGVKQIIVSEMSAARQKHVKNHSDMVLDPTKLKIGDECRQLTGGEGVDIVFDCAGVMPALEDGMDALKVQGTYVNIAGWEKPLIMPFALWHMKEIIFRASMSYNEADFAEVVRDFIDGKFHGVEEMVTSRITLEEVVKGGFEELILNKDKHVKILVTPKSELL